MGPTPEFWIRAKRWKLCLDVQWSGAVARNATIDFVLSASTNTTDGVALSAQYVVDTNIAPVLSISFGLCEALLGSEFQNQFFDSVMATGSR